MRKNITEVRSIGRNRSDVRFRGENFHRSIRNDDVLDNIVRQDELNLRPKRREPRAVIYNVQVDIYEVY